MNQSYFFENKFSIDELIWIMNEKGEGFSGLFKGYTNNNFDFLFLNYSNGKLQTIRIEKLQRAERINT
jgi:hypothetical protein